MRIIEEAEVRKVVSAEKCVEIMKKALLDLEEGRCEMPPRLITIMPNTAKFGFMPAWLGDYYGAKVITAYGPNAGTGYPTHIGYVMLFESEHSTVAGLVDATAVTEIRTGAVSAVATDVLARKDAHTMAIIGAGAQARSHTAAIVSVRKIDAITVYDMRSEAAVAFKNEIEAQYGISVSICQSVAECVKDADIKPGAHVNAVGTFTPATREAASDLVAASRLYADQVAAMKRESGEYLIPLQEGLITEEHIVGSIGEVLAGRKPGRQTQEEITLFDALGLAVEDVATAVYALEASKA